MQKIGEEISMVNKVFLVVTLAACLVAILPISLLAKVKGPCATCHTMHNSQNGATQVFAGEDAMWNAGVLTGTGLSTTTPQPNLLKTDCVGCHTATGSVPTVDLGSGNIVPIVWNTGGYPTPPLAGGNFNGVANGNQSFGHNVYGVGDSAQWIDTDHPTGAPGKRGIISCENSCHNSLGLASSPDGAFSDTYNYNGCRGCHFPAGQGGGHHDPNETSFRMLKGHLAGSAEIVQGIADPGWEGGGGRNTYLNVAYTGDLEEITIGRFCSGCHGDFHAIGEDWVFFGNINEGDNLGTALGNPWLRHPNDVVIPSTYEYLDVTDGSEPYNKNIPVGQFVTDNFIQAGDKVICLSCHRAHASDQPDALRWPYLAQMAHNAPGNDDTSGCFFCHRNKDNQT